MMIRLRRRLLLWLFNRDTCMYTVCCSLELTSFPFYGLSTDFAIEDRDDVETLHSRTSGTDLTRVGMSTQPSALRTSQTINDVATQSYPSQNKCRRMQHMTRENCTFSQLYQTLSYHLSTTSPHPPPHPPCPHPQHKPLPLHPPSPDPCYY